VKPNDYTGCKYQSESGTNANGISLRIQVHEWSPVSIVSDYELDVWAIGVRSPAGAKYFSSILCVQTGTGAHPASCTMGTGVLFTGGKARPRRDADHPPHLVPRS
jgi:hypothetical protein